MLRVDFLGNGFRLSRVLLLSVFKKEEVETPIGGKNEIDHLIVSI